MKGFHVCIAGQGYGRKRLCIYFCLVLVLVFALFWIGTLPKNEQFAPENGWLEYDRFRPNFQGAFASSREGNRIWSNYSDLSRPGPAKDS